VDVKIKICGITSRRDAQAATEAGVNALGFIFAPDSPRSVSLVGAARIIDDLPPFISKVAVTVDAPEGTIRQIIETCGVDTVQLHGNEPPEFCARFENIKVIKAFQVRPELSLESLRAYAFVTDAWLLDTYRPGKAGGTGVTFNWETARQIRQIGHPIILAGGLGPANVAQAIAQVQPFAVDVASGVESSPGHKDLQKLVEFVRAVQNCNSRGYAPENSIPKG